MTNPLNTDIVVLLREYEPYNELHGQAADEIERLQQVADDLANHLRGYVCHCQMSKCKCGYDDVMDAYEAVRGE